MLYRFSYTQHGAHKLTLGNYHSSINTYQSTTEQFHTNTCLN
jgi:hypothetical protein